MDFVTHQMHGALGEWTLVTWTPARLAGIVEHMWHFDGCTAYPRERVMPDARFEVILHLHGRYGIVRDAGVERCAELSVGGLRARPFVIEAPASRCTIVGIQLTPAAAWRLFRQPLHELACVDIDLHALIGRDARSLLEACLAAPTPEACLRAIAGWIASRVGAGAPPDPAAAWIARRIRERRGNVAIAALRDAAGLSTTRLAALFREQVGTTPKVYARLHRFQHALERIRAGNCRLADVALDTGYYDQAHLTGEFRELSGLTPSGFACSLDYGVGVNVPEA